MSLILRIIWSVSTFGLFRISKQGKALSVSAASITKVFLREIENRKRRRITCGRGGLVNKGTPSVKYHENISIKIRAYFVDFIILQLINL